MRNLNSNELQHVYGGGGTCTGGKSESKHGGHKSHSRGCKSKSHSKKCHTKSRSHSNGCRG